MELPQMPGAEELSMKSLCHRGYGAMAARLTPDQKVGSSSLSVNL